jgi:hypothetical protein
MKDNTANLMKIDNIKFLFEKVHKNNRIDLYEKVASEFEMKISSVRTGWFTRFEIPERYKVQENLIEFMQKYIANQQTE